MRSTRKIFGTFVYDWPRLIGVLVVPGRWIFMRNRSDDISVSPDRSGVRCDWVHTRTLHLCNLFAIAAQWLLRRALKECPIRFLEHPVEVHASRVCVNEGVLAENFPQVSFLIGHRGTDRLPHLLATLRSIASQKNVSFECIVVEQDQEPLIRDELPDWVRYHFCLTPYSTYSYNRSWAFNEAARIAKGAVLILHDNDMLIPEQYGAGAYDLFRCGYEVAQLKRFVFYLTQHTSQHILKTSHFHRRARSEQVIENLCGGGSIAISRSVYWDIGGMDEEFVGWGGEDEEFWDRCRARKVWGFSCFPLVHIWHASQPMKYTDENPTAVLLDRKMRLPAEERVRRLGVRGGHDF